MRKLKARELHDFVIEEVGRRILAGEFPPGTPLPREESLCGMLGISRTALREALRVLASKGLVEPKRKIGTVIRPRPEWNFLDADVLSWRLEGQDAQQAITELYELRHLIEPLAASLAAERATKGELELLRRSFEDMCAAGDDGERIIAPDLTFHRTIIAASGNHLFSSLAPIIGKALAVNFELVRKAPSGHPHSMPAHRKVLEAIETRKPAAARLAMQKLIEESQQEARLLNLTTASGQRGERGRSRAVNRRRG